MGANKSDVLIVAKNIYVQKTLLTINIEVVDCATKTLSTNGGTGLVSTLMDFSTVGAPVAHTIQWNEFVFDSPGCIVDRYEVICRDPDAKLHEVDHTGSVAPFPQTDPNSLC